MGRIVLVRHGQASLGSADYDRLSERGAAQCRALGAYWQGRDARFVRVLRGSLRRHRESLDGIAQALPGLPAAGVDSALNEYDADALIRAVNDGRLTHPTDPTAVKAHFKLLRRALLRWMEGDIAPDGMPSFASFRDGIAAVLVEARTAAAHGDVLVVSSGGPISTAVSIVLGAAPSSLIALNMRLRNSALAELVTTADGIELDSFNVVPHLDAEPALMTHA